MEGKWIKRFKKLTYAEPRRLVSIFMFVYDETILRDGGWFQKRLGISIRKNLSKEKYEIDTFVEGFCIVFKEALLEALNKR